jgi:RNA polymerase sigma-70 factor (sigma-E family)
MAQATASDEDFAAFVATRQRRLQQTAWLLTGSVDQAEDLVQDALAKMWRHWSRVRQVGDPDAYVHRVLVNTFISSRRRRWWAERPSDTLPEAADRSGRDSDVRLSVAQALQRLSPKQRAVVVLRFYADLSVDQVASALDLPIGTVKSTSSKALDQLRQDPSIHALVEERS